MLSVYILMEIQRLYMHRAHVHTYSLERTVVVWTRNVVDRKKRSVGRSVAAFPVFDFYLGDIACLLTCALADGRRL